MPGVGLTHGPPAEKTQAAVTTGSAGTSGIPRAMVLTVSFVLSPGTGFIAPVIREYVITDLAPAPGRQDHTTSPSVTSPFVCTHEARCEPLRPPHPTSRFLTIAIRPSDRGGMTNRNIISENKKVKYCCKSDV
jgi:hypothetical protein